MAEPDVVAAMRIYLDLTFPLVAGSSVAITIDERTDPEVVRATELAVRAKACAPELVPCDLSAPAYDAVGRAQEARVSESRYWIDFTRMSALYSPFSRRYVEDGGHFLVMSGLTRDGLAWIAGDHDVRHALDEAASLFRRIRRGRQLRLFSASGTDLRAPIQAPALDLAGVARHLERRGSQKLFFGQLVVPLRLDALQGTLVVEDYLWPPDGIGRPRAPVRCVLENGMLSRLDVSASEAPVAEHFSCHEDSGIREVVHLTLGTLDALRPGDSLLINERVRGAATFGFGRKWQNCRSHVDMVCLDLSMVVDDTALVREGRICVPS